MALYTHEGNRFAIIIENVERRILHGNLTPLDVAHALLAEFDRGALRAQILGREDDLIVQIGTRPGVSSGGPTALTVMLQKTADGLLIHLGQQEWLGTAASLGQTALAALLNPWNLLHRLDDLAQDLENLQLSQRIWQAIERVAQAHGATQELSERLRRVTCDYCGTANPIGEGACLACGAPLGTLQPHTCPRCGFVIKPGELECPNCKQTL